MFWNSPFIECFFLFIFYCRSIGCCEGGGWKGRGPRRSFIRPRDPSSAGAGTHWGRHGGQATVGVPATDPVTHFRCSQRNTNADGEDFIFGPKNYWWCSAVHNEGCTELAKLQLVFCCWIISKLSLFSFLSIIITMSLLTSLDSLSDALSNEVLGIVWLSW